MILFLDFDGVLHPQHDDGTTPADRVFCHLPRFEAVMRDFPSVEIVISSMWREQYSLDEMRAHFSLDIADRIVGTTPTTPRIDGKYMPARREGEILDWLTAAGRLGEPWLALDDADWQFQRYRDRVVACKWCVGLDDSTEAALRTALAACGERTSC